MIGPKVEHKINDGTFWARSLVDRNIFFHAYKYDLWFFVLSLSLDDDFIII